MIRSCGAIIFRKNARSIIEYLLLRAYSNWDFPKGIHESEDDDHVETAKREIEEETSLNNVTFVTKNKEKLFIETTPYSRPQKIARFYLCYVSHEESKKVFLPKSDELGHPEHEECRWLSSVEAKKLLNERLKKVIDWAEEQLKGVFS